MQFTANVVREKPDVPETILDDNFLNFFFVVITIYCVRLRLNAVKKLTISSGRNLVLDEI